MRLKVSPRQALTTIDTLLRKGWEELRGLHKKYDTELKSNPEFSKAMQEDPTGVQVHSRIRVPMEVTPATLQEIALAFEEWSVNVSTALESIYIDYAPMYTFTRAQPPSPTGHPHENQKTAALWERHYDLWECKLDVIAKFYYDLRTFVRIPLMYREEEAEIWFYDLCCPLELQSNEALLCEYMFERDFGRPVDCDDVRGFILGATKEGPTKAVNNAANGVNKKTRERFGFSIFSSPEKTNTIILKPPVTVISAMLQNAPYSRKTK